MNTMMRRTAMAGAAVAIGGVLVAAPVLAAGPDDAGDPNGSRSGYGAAAGARDSRGSGTTSGTGGQRSGGGSADGSCLVDVATGTLDSDEEAALAYWVEEEKVARDLYLMFADQYDLRVFEQIARSEQSHMDAVGRLLDTYGLTNPTTGTDPGEFTSAELQALYDQLLEQGEVSLEAALEVGQAVEVDDLDLLDDLGEIDAPDVQQVVDRQINASQRHLAAFGG
jgi:hypothetical protein